MIEMIRQGTVWPRGQWPTPEMMIYAAIIGFLSGMALGRVIWG